MAQKSSKTVLSKEKGLNRLSIILIAAVLRYNTNENNKLSTSQIAELLSDITLQDVGEKSVKRHLNYIQALTDIAEGVLAPMSSNESEKSDVTSLSKEEAENRLNALVSVMGGYIRCSYLNETAALKKAKNSKMLYYFDPIINESEFELIKGAITSNRYIRNQELIYLTDALHFLHPNISQVDGISVSTPEKVNTKLKRLPACYQSPPKRSYKNQASIILKNINTIYDAIRDKHQIEFTYGVFEEKHNRISFVSDTKGCRVLNPYAMLWSNGQQYLIATPVDNADHVFHFRIDRIYGDVVIHKEARRLSSGHEVKKATPRADIPDSLKSYFKRNVFQEDMYRSTHPHMAYSINNTSEEVLLNCSQKSLATIIDNFGQDGQHIIGRTVITKSTKSKLPFPDGYTIKLLDADYNAVKHFCLHLQNDIYVIEPESLRKEIISEIRARLDTYSSIE